MVLGKSVCVCMKLEFTSNYNDIKFSFVRENDCFPRVIKAYNICSCLVANVYAIQSLMR